MLVLVPGDALYTLPLALITELYETKKVDGDGIHAKLTRGTNEWDRYVIRNIICDDSIQVNYGFIKSMRLSRRNVFEVFLLLVFFFLIPSTTTMRKGS